MCRSRQGSRTASLSGAVLLAGWGLAGCQQGQGPIYYQRAGRCQVAWSEADYGDRFVVFRVPSQDFPLGITMQLFYPSEAQALPDGAPVVVVLHGGFSNDVVPVANGEQALLSGQGLIQLYLNFPGGTGDWSSPGVSDSRGPHARMATALALRYAAGLVADEDDCSLADRVPVPVSAVPPLIHGHSNGGNLAVATLADPSLDLPDVAGITTFEAPAASQFVTVEVGSQWQPQPLYQQGVCSVDPTDGILCQLPLPDSLDENEEVFGPEGAYNIEIGGEGIIAWIADQGRGITYRALQIGGTDKPPWLRGRYGEGLKVAALWYSMNGYNLYLWARPNILMKCFSWAVHRVSLLLKKC